MLHSMTGYGIAEKHIKSNIIYAEIKSVNSKTLDLKINLPEIFRPYEPDIRKYCSKHLVRGKIDMSISIESSKGSLPAIDLVLAKHYKSEINKLSKFLGLSSEISVNELLKLPNLITTSNIKTKIEWSFANKVCAIAISSLVAFRLKEGLFLEKDLIGRIKKIQSLLKKISNIAPQRIKKIRSRLSSNFDQIINHGKIDKNRFEQEVLYYLEKLDISEELTRLDGHLAYFTKELKFKNIAKGKKLGFISQEIGREINTIGAKSNDAKMQVLVVEMKDELEKIKEQLANVL